MVARRTPPTRRASHGATAGHPWRLGRFPFLMPFRVEEVLLVSSPYDSFTMEEDGLLTEMIFAEYTDLGLPHAPNVTRVPTAKEALDAVSGGEFDLVIAMPRVGTMRLGRFRAEMAVRAPHIPVVFLVSSEAELLHVTETEPDLDTSDIFMWHGDASLLVAIVKHVEDRANVEHDARAAGVGSIIMVEDSPRFRSVILPIIYSELVRQTRAVLADALNRMQRHLRMRARPKVLIAETYETAMMYYHRHRKTLFGVISDVKFPRGGRKDAEAGLRLIETIRYDDADLPILLQSSDESNRLVAESCGASFLHKGSPTLLKDLSDFIHHNFGFGDFIFRAADGREVGRAPDLRALIKVLPKIPDESIAYHAQRNHFSSWFRARTEFELANRLRPRQVSEFRTTEEIRTFLIDTCNDMIRRQRSGVVEDFSPHRFESATRFARIGSGSLGAKARGLAFVDAFLAHCGVQAAFPDVDIHVPQTVVVGTDVFDEFMDRNGLTDVNNREASDRELAERFLAADLPKWLVKDLRVFLRSVLDPLAVRSSSVLEDSEFHPFAGIYRTFMLANSHPDNQVRLRHVADAIKLVFASNYAEAARRYIDNTPYHLEAQKMAVVLQPVVGQRHGQYYYPTLAGTARSRNYYPVGPMKPENGTATIALGMGEQVVSGGAAIRFSPAHPRILHQMDDPEEFLATCQRTFRAVDLQPVERGPADDDFSSTVELPLDEAQRHGTLPLVGSVWSPDNEAFYDGTSRPGIPVVSFAHILKNDVFPLAEILERLLQVGEDGLNTPVEIEFAANLETKPPQFAVLQMRPFSRESDDIEVDIDDVRPEDALCISDMSLGNGVITEVRDIVYVCPSTFDRNRTEEIAVEIGAANDELRRGGRPSMIIGPGRWGTSNRWLGIPVTWEQISTARILVETSLEGFSVDPSQGSHFFHNLTSLGVKYLAVRPKSPSNFIDWEWLDEHTSAQRWTYVRHVRLKTPIEARVDGRRSLGVVLKTQESNGGARR